MAMNRSNLFLFGIVIVSQFVPFLLGGFLKQLPKEIQLLFNGTLSISLIGLFIIKNKMTQYDASGYDVLRANIDGETIKDLPIRKGWKRATVQNPRAPWLNVTPFEFPYEIKIPGYGDKVKRIHITHFDSITNRLESVFQENVSYKGDEVEHNNVYLVNLWKNDRFPVSQEEGLEEPNFILVSASKADRSDKKMKTRILATALALDKVHMARLANQPNTTKELVQRLTLENERLMQNHVEDMMLMPQLVEAADYWKVEAIATKGKLEATTQEVTGMIDDELNVKKAGERRIEQKVSNIADVKQLKKDKGNFFKEYAKWIVIGVIAIAIIVFLGTNPKIFQNIANIPTGTLALYVILGGILVVGIYYVSNMIRSKKE